MKVFISIVTASLLFFSCAGTPDEQGADSREQIAESSEQVIDSSEQVAESSDEQVVESSEQIIEGNEQLAEIEEALIIDNELTEGIAEAENIEPTTEIIDEQPQVPSDTAVAEDEDTSESGEQIAEIREQVGEIRDQLTEIREQLALLLGQLAERSEPPPAPAVVEPPQVVQPPETVIAPPAVVQPPVVAQPSVQEQGESSETDELAESEEPSETEAVPLPLPLREFPQTPAARIEPLLRLGAEPNNQDIVFSRIVRVTVGQLLEIPYRGTGWVFLGELASRRGIVFNSRRNDPEGMSFIFNVEEAGTFVLKFFREDFLRGYIINDYVQVIAGEAAAAAAGWFNAPVDRSRVIAQPRWPSAAEEAQLRSGIRPDAAPVVSGITPDTSSQQTVSVQESASSLSQPAVSQQASAASGVSPNAAAQPQFLSPETASSERLPPDVILQRAGESFNRGNVAAAIALLDQYMDYYPGGSDEVYWLYGQFYEANSPDRNILRSLDYYNKLVKEYPQSARFADARSRIAYLERFYINIR